MVESLPLLTHFPDDMNHQRCSAGKERTKKSRPSNHNEPKRSVADKAVDKDAAKKERNKNSKDRHRARSKGDPKDAKTNSDSKESGLSPPKSAEVVGKNVPEQEIKTCPTMKSAKEASSRSGIFDKTQWERTRFAKEAAGLVNNSAEAPGMEKEEAREAKMLGESKQSIAVKGEYLNERPSFTVTLLGIELVWCVVALLVWGAAADNPVLPQILAIFNMLIIFGLILMCMSVEYFRFQVRREDTRSDTRYFVPYLWRYVLCEAHVARVLLLCANITIMVFDNDFDVGSVIVLAATPLHLIIASIHIFIAFKPKRQ